MMYTSKYGDFKVFAKSVEQAAISQVFDIANSPLGEDAHIRIMPDAHAGKGCVIGTTMRYNGKICPNVVGVDIGCGVLAYKLDCSSIDFEKLDEACRYVIVSGRNARDRAIRIDYQKELLSDLRCWDNISNKEYIFKSLGTLGGGNHFIEIDTAEDGSYWLMIHSGSRNLGKQVADIYQKLAIKQTFSTEKERSRIIKDLKAEGRVNEIQSTLSKLKKKTDIPKELSILKVLIETIIFMI